MSLLIVCTSPFVLTLGARDFSCAVSDFGQVLKSDPLLVSSAFGRTRVGLRPTKRSSPSHARKTSGTQCTLSSTCLWKLYLLLHFFSQRKFKFAKPCAVHVWWSASIRLPLLFNPYTLENHYVSRSEPWKIRNIRDFTAVRELFEKIQFHSIWSPYINPLRYRRSTLTSDLPNKFRAGGF